MTMAIMTDTKCEACQSRKIETSLMILTLLVGGLRDRRLRKRRG